MIKYQSYKTSGVEWVGEIPEHWKKCRLKNVSKSVNGYSFKSDDFDREYDIPVIRIGDVGDIIDFEDCIKVKSDFLKDKKDFIVCRNDILIGLTGGTIGKSGRYNYDTPSLLNQRVGLLRNSKDLLNGLLYHYVKSEVFIRYIYFDCYGGGQDNISMNDILKMVFPLPPLSEQHQIVQFLDEKTDLIDKLILTKERKIILLKEQRTSLINEVVTKGLNPNVKMKNSGVEWIGEIPEHWGVKKFTYITDIINCGYTSTPEYVDEGVMFLSSQNVKKGKLDLWKYNFISRELHDELTKNRKVKKGDLLVVRVGVGIGNSCVVEIDDEFSIYVSLTHVSLRDGYLNYYFNYLFNSIKFIDECILLSKQGGGVGNFNVKDFERFKFSIPTYNEQLQIVVYLDTKTKEIDDLVQLEQKKIDLLKEYRQSLISDVVTGKIKVTK
jgi:type I restriction enzyme S subunit